MCEILGLNSSSAKERERTKISQPEPDMVAHACNPSFLVDGDQEDQVSRLAWAKRLRDSISTNKPGVVVHACRPSYVGRINRRIAVQG
jgi:hypothetical protein